MDSASQKLPEILVVEDNEGDRRLIREALLDQKVNLTFVPDGIEAIQHLRREGEYRDARTPSLIILDLNLPRKDGLDLVTEIKEDVELRLIPVVVFTTSRAQSDIENSYAAHANCYITKPHDLEEYLSAIRDLEKFWLQTAVLPKRFQ